MKIRELSRTKTYKFSNHSTIVIMDNASIHKEPKIRNAIEKVGFTLLYLPPILLIAILLNIAG